MSDIAILGAGAFGTALAVALARDGQDVTLWARDPVQAEAMRGTRENRRHLPGHALPDRLAPTAELPNAARAGTLLLTVPMQELGGLLRQNRALFRQKTLVACCKGIDLQTGFTPARVIREEIPDARPAVLSGPSFAADIAAGLPTALTVAADDAAQAAALQAQLSTSTVRLYASTDLTGVGLGGALKNVIAIACGVCIGAGLGESARAALLTRGFAEMQRNAPAFGALPETLSGLSGLGDLALTCTSEKSRNYRFGLAFGQFGGHEAHETTEGIATARALAARAAREGLDMPVTEMVAALLDRRLTVAEATEMLLSRPLRAE